MDRPSRPGRYDARRGIGLIPDAPIAFEATVSASASVSLELVRHGLTQVKAENEFGPDLPEI